MTPDQFRALALALPESEEGSHMGHPDFRVRGRIFATLGPDGDWAMVKLSAERQAELARAHPSVFEAFGGAWGRRGATRVHLRAARRALVKPALESAWRRAAPEELLGGGGGGLP